MTSFEVLATVTTLAALFSWINHQWVRLPPAIGQLVVAMLASLAMIGLHAAGWFRGDPLLVALRQFDFHDVLLNGMLGALLFAGALHVQMDELWGQRWVVLSLATGSVVISTLAVGGGAWLAFRALGATVPWEYCLLFGALISPTDPIAVSAILETAGVPRTLSVQLTGESLFNDGFGVVVFLVVLDSVIGATHSSAVAIARLFVVEVVGGVLYGAAVGYLLYRLLKSIDDYQVEILLTLALVTGGYALAQRLHVSGPLAMVVAGLMIGNQGRAFAMSARTRDRLDSFWELADSFLNSILFVLVGLELIAIDLGMPGIVTGFLLVPVVLLARAISVSLPMSLLRLFRRAVKPKAIALLTWCGIRGGISLALALSLPPGRTRDLVVTATYVIVASSIVIQGLSVGPLTRRLWSDL